MNKNEIEFWRSGYFWRPAVMIMIICNIILALILFGIASSELDESKEDFKYKEFVFRAASGEAIEDRDAWPDYIYALKYGRYLSDQKRKGADLDAILKQVVDLRADIQNRRENDRPQYEHFLADKYQTPWILIEMTKGKNWINIENNPEDIVTLKAILSGDKFNLEEPDPSIKINAAAAVIFFAIIQFIAYLIGLGNYDDHKRNEYKIRQAKLSIGAFVTFLVFSPGALLIIAIQLIMIGKHQIPEYVLERREGANAFPNLRSVEVDSEAQNKLLQKLRERLED